MSFVESRRPFAVAFAVSIAFAVALLVPACGGAPEPTSGSDHPSARAVAPPEPAASTSPEYGTFGQCYNGLLWCDATCEDDYHPDSCRCECRNAYCECTGKCELRDCTIY